jgi:Flp pilus assembly pilin Flp
MKRKTDSAAAILEHILLIALIAISAVTGVKALGQALKQSLTDTMLVIDGQTGFPECGLWGQPPCP